MIRNRIKLGWVINIYLSRMDCYFQCTNVAQINRFTLFNDVRPDICNESKFGGP